MKTLRRAGSAGSTPLVTSLLLLLVQCLSAAELHVPSGYRTISAAVDTADPGDIIRIAAGEYYEQILITNKPDLTLEGEEGTVLNAFYCDDIDCGDFTIMERILESFGAATYPIIGIYNSKVTLRNLTINGNELGDFYPSALFGVVFRGAGGRVENCTIRGFRGSGSTEARGINLVNFVSLDTPAVEMQVVGSTFENNNLALGLIGDTTTAAAGNLRVRCTVSGNQFKGVGASVMPALGVYISTGVSGLLSSNVFHDYAYNGAVTDFAAGILAHDISGGSRGTYLPLQPLRFIGNTFINSDHGLFFAVGNNCQVVSNTFVGVGNGWRRWGALTLSGNNVLVAHNSFSNTPIAIELFGGEANNNVSRGNATNTRLFTNRFERVYLPWRVQPLVAGLVEQGNEIMEWEPPVRELRVPSEFSTIQKAVNAAAPGDTIRIAAGDYREQIAIGNKIELTIVGEPGTKIHAQSGMTEVLKPFGWLFFPALGAFRTDITIRNLAFEGHQLGSEYTQLLGIFAQAANLRVENCTFNGFSGPDAGVYNAAGIRVQNGIATGSDVVEVDIFNSTFSQNEIAMHLRGEPVNNPTLLRTIFTVEGNTVSGMGPSGGPYDGITVRNGATGVIQANIISNHVYSGDGPAFSSGIAAYDDNAKTRNGFLKLYPIRIEGNRFVNNDEHVVLIGANNSEVLNNIFDGTGDSASRWGALALSGTDIHVRDNNFSRMRAGIVTLGKEALFTAWPEVPLALNAKVSGNWFCEVAEPVEIRSGAVGTDVVESGDCSARSLVGWATNAPSTLKVRSWQGKNAIIETSTNLRDWTRVQTNQMDLPVTDVGLATDQSAPVAGFYRSVIGSQ